MARLLPLGLRLIDPAWVDRVPAPAHDALSPDERRRYVARYPDSYLTVTRSPDDLRPGEVWDAAGAARASRAALERLLGAGAFGPVSAPTFYLYRLAQDDHTQVGVVAAVSTADYDRGVIRVHEQVRADRVAHLSSQTAVVGVQSSPIAVAYRPNDVLGELIATTIDQMEPTVDFAGIDGVHQQVWSVDVETCAAIRELLADEPLYLIDGHHRAAAASHLNAAAGPGSDWMLAALFSAADLRNESFHRHLPGVDPGWLLHEIGRRFPIRRADGVDAVLRRHSDEVPLLTRSEDGAPHWHLVSLPVVAPGPTEAGGHDTVDGTTESRARATTGPGSSTSEALATEILGGLEPVRLEHHILRPLSPVAAAVSQRALHVELSHGRADRADLEALQARVTDPVWVMRPIPLEAIMAASDAGAMMPAKSTYFRPKVRSGVFLRHLQ